MKHFLFSFFILSLLYSCNKQTKIIVVDRIVAVTKEKQDDIGPDWHFKDMVDDTLAGISLQKAYNELLKDKQGDTVIVAVIDTETDINHEDLVGSFWVNQKEIPDNNIDDDNNGYVDDIHGWNFLGNAKGENVIFSNYEVIRILRKYDSLFYQKTEADIDPALLAEFQLYQKALSEKQEIKVGVENLKKRAEVLLNRVRNATSFFDSIYGPDANKEALIKSYQPVDSMTEKLKKDKLLFLKGGLTDDLLLTLIEQQEGLLTKSLDPQYNERTITGDDPYNIGDKNYGNNNVSGNLKELYHGTLVSGILSANRNDTIGVKGISDHILLMPLAISANGDEHDKDIALAIRYAVDNGADIINMSSGKSYSLNQQWVQDAVRYAADNDVLFVTSAGNDNLDLDTDKHSYYPNDNVDNETEISDSFIMVGASTSYPNERFLFSSSNYGKNNVDIFAPGVGIKTTIPFHKYRLANATSVATPIVAGVAALLKSYYPEFTAAEIKDILLQSGTTYQVEVEIEQEDGTTKTVPFSELSKSGKVVNAYNALLMAEQLSKN
ncbi:S8 family serine peptidase [Aquimarina brevivitae]|uniref:Subtilase family protein n=1 Tax=Aquimarina brevivitae TaxID=323412 RepID=A0A4Q7P391_9FLAO|nr:S8 family serine peptidase [Aquimarina brevivitae]RZS93870.1 subtilase family protein [Aquimarina brevivitae]